MPMNPRLMRPLARRQAPGTPASLLLRFDGNFNDSSVNDLTVTAEGDAEISTTQSKFGGSSADLTAEGARLSVASSEYLNVAGGDFTIEMWVYIDSSNSDQYGRLIQFGDYPLTGGWTVSRNSSSSPVSLVLETYDPGFQYLTGGVVDDTSWTHVAVTRESGALRLFVNGAIVASNDDNPELGNADINIGANSAGAENLSCYIDDLRIVKGLAVYTGPFIPPEAPLSAIATPVPVSREASLLLRFDGNFNDSSVNDLTVTVVGEDLIATTLVSKFGGASAYFPPDLNASASNYLSISDPTALNLSGDFTVELWFYPTTYANGGGNGDFQCLFAGDADFTYGVMMDGSGVMRMWAGSGEGWDLADYVAPSSPVPLNQWSHIAMVRSGAVFSLYLNGVGQSHDSGSTAGVVSGAIRVGIWGNGQSPINDGYIDDLRIVKGLAVYTGPFTPPEAPLSAVATPVPVSREASLLLHFDGDFTDSSPNDLTVTANGDAEISTTESKFGGASAVFDGSDYLEIPSHSSLQFGGGDFTVEFFVKATSSQFLMGMGDGASVAGSAFAYAPGIDVLAFYFDATESASLTGVTLTANVWQHIAFGRRGSTLYFYKDGVEVATGLIGSGVINAVASPLKIGGYVATGLDGYIDDLRITKGLSVYTGPFIPPEAPLSAVATPVPVSREASLLLRFDGDFTDSSPSNLTVTAQGDAEISTTESKFGGASGFFGGSGHLSVSTAASEFAFDGDFTVEFWLYPVSGTADYSVLYIYDGAAFLAVNINDENWNLYLNAGSVSEAPFHSLADGEWNHVAMVRSGGTLTIYTNGAADASFSSSGTLGYASPAEVRIMSFPSGGREAYIDDLRVVKGLAVYDGDFVPPTTALSVNAAPYAIYKPYGTFLFSECVDGDLTGTYADGTGGRYTEIISAGSC